MMKYQRRIFAYIHTLVPSRSDAEDILQKQALPFVRNLKILNWVQISIHGHARLLTGKFGQPGKICNCQGGI